jgi:carbonic anhydrase
MKLNGLPLLIAVFLPAAFAQHEKPGAGPTAQQVIERLRHGNDEYAAGRIDTSRITVKQRSEVAQGQHPIATVLTCADSRVPPEAIFGQGLGDLFVVRVAGAVASPPVLGSIEYAAQHLGSRVVIIMGHTSCGAVKAVLDKKTPPAHPEPAGANLESLLVSLRPALGRPQTHGDAWTSAVYASVDQTMEDMRRGSPVLRKMETDGALTLVGAVYELQTGRVVFSKPLAVRAAH